VAERSEESQARRKMKQSQYKSREKVYDEWEKRREKAQQYHVRETLDADGDIMWTLSGPTVRFASHSIDAIRSFLTHEGVEWRAVRFEPHVWPGAPEANDGSA
jgi:hypothetical protein